MPADHPTTSRLVELAQDGSREALERLFAKLYPDILQAARLRLGPLLRSRMDTVDLAQTAYYEAYRDLSHYRYRGKGSFRRWLLAIVENKIRGHLKSLKAQRRDVRREVPLEPGKPPPARTTSPTRKLVDHEDRARLEDAMDHMPDIYREVIVLRYYLGLPWREVGAELDRSEEAAQMLCRRALLRLKELYGG